MTSQIKTVLFLGLLTGLLMMLGGAMGGRAGLFLAFALAMLMNVSSYWYADKIVLGMYKARELSPGDAPHIHRVVEEMAANAGIPKPRIFLIPQDAPNAFATGRDPEHAVVAVTRGIVNMLSPAELKGVLAHELGHIANRDILIQTIAAVLAGAIVYIATMLQWTAIFGGMSGDDDEGGSPLAALAMAFLAPVAATLIQMAISRSREYLADATGARLSHPLDLAGALGKLDAVSRQVPLEGNPATENMFIVNPFSGRRATSLFATHPPIEDRIARLRAMAQGR
ncbi:MULTISPECIES: zinc metalloprotease HtpX [unclassified Pseudodesulfovibrio]|uniref:zinc metalloprotease HtpX n=1 Tax=unclassified Pseudodesulfovibrio TaxID=2661612 RepID=UPI000FEBD6D2|nr:MULTISPECIES: zinc metalloprotease HtpX [unclassified Pseudodesulfovibrio]MCJ2165513.1 zinc metalloprotease HtpX [Pseudodesulfovibrio sp. S3-i]RWU03122.1 protease HtpX [Pseudodesulfovibrio sp. S3]